VSGCKDYFCFGSLYRSYRRNHVEPTLVHQEYICSLVCRLAEECFMGSALGRTDVWLCMEQMAGSWRLHWEDRCLVIVQIDWGRWQGAQLSSSEQRNVWSCTDRPEKMGGSQLSPFRKMNAQPQQSRIQTDSAWTGILMRCPSELGGQVVGGLSPALRPPTYLVRRSPINGSIAFDSQYPRTSLVAN
jgi:hypothetical protein